MCSTVKQQQDTTSRCSSDSSSCPACGTDAQQQASSVDTTWLVPTCGDGGEGDGLVGGAYSSKNEQQVQFLVSRSHR
jgi:hypothetical protein